MNKINRTSFLIASICFSACFLSCQKTIWKSYPLTFADIYSIPEKWIQEASDKGTFYWSIPGYGEPKPKFFIAYDWAEPNVSDVRSLSDFEKRSILSRRFEGLSILNESSFGVGDQQLIRWKFGEINGVSTVAASRLHRKRSLIVTMTLQGPMKALRSPKLSLLFEQLLERNAKTDQFSTFDTTAQRSKPSEEIKTAKADLHNVVRDGWWPHFFGRDYVIWVPASWIKKDHDTVDQVQYKGELANGETIVFRAHSIYPHPTDIEANTIPEPLELVRQKIEKREGNAELIKSESIPFVDYDGYRQTWSLSNGKKSFFVWTSSPIINNIFGVELEWSGSDESMPLAQNLHSEIVSKIEKFTTTPNGERFIPYLVDNLGRPFYGMALQAGNLHFFEDRALPYLERALKEGDLTLKNEVRKYLKSLRSPNAQALLANDIPDSPDPISDVDREKLIEAMNGRDMDVQNIVRAKIDSFGMDIAVDLFNRVYRQTDKDASRGAESWLGSASVIVPPDSNAGRAIAGLPWKSFINLCYAVFRIGAPLELVLPELSNGFFNLEGNLPITTEVALQALAKAFEPEMKVLTTSSDPMVSIPAARAFLSNHNVEPWVYTPLVNGLKSPDKRVRFIAAQSFSMAQLMEGRTHLIPDLAAVLGDEYEIESRSLRKKYAVGDYAAQALVRIGKDSVPTLRPIYYGGVPALRRRIDRAIEHSRSQSFESAWDLLKAE